MLCHTRCTTFIRINRVRGNKGITILLIWSHSKAEANMLKNAVVQQVTAVTLYGEEWNSEPDDEKKWSGDTATAASISFTAKWKRDSDHTWSSNDWLACLWLSGITMRISATRFQEVRTHCHCCTPDIHLTLDRLIMICPFSPTGQDEQHFDKSKEFSLRTRK